MTIHAVEQMWSRESSSDQSSDGLRFRRTYRSAYQVSHSADATLDEIRTASAGGVSVPRVRDGFGSYTNVFCTNVGGVERVGPAFSIVPVEYEGEVSLDGDSPELQPPDIDYGSAATVEEVDRDGYGQPITNTVGDPVSGLQGTINDMVLRVKRNFLAVNGPLARRYLNSVNSDSMLVLGDVWSPGEAHLERYSAKPVFNKLGNVAYFSVDAQVRFREPINTVSARAWWHRFRNEGKRIRYATRVTFTGGGGSRAAGYAIASAGAITKVVLTSYGVGYTSAPTVSFASDTGGTGATATAVLGQGPLQGEIFSVTIGAGGTGYKSGIEPALDRNKEPVTEPVLIAADGSKEESADSAFFVERPQFPFYLPYNVLGLLD